jgi:hypothetical protein
MDFLGRGERMFVRLVSGCLIFSLLLAGCSCYEKTPCENPVDVSAWKEDLVEQGGRDGVQRMYPRAEWFDRSLPEEILRVPFKAAAVGFTAGLWVLISLARAGCFNR